MTISQDIIDNAKSGDAKALEALVRGIQDNVHRLAIRMLADPQAAQDATQEILIRVITKLSTFEGNSKFETWVYRVATNYLLTARKAIAADPGLNFQIFSQDLLEGLADEQSAAADDHVMLNELRVRCTIAMLLCLDRDHRAAYILGDVLEFSHTEAADILNISPANYRKRLSRARADVQDFTAASCGLANRSAACSCRKRLPAAMAMGRVGKDPSVLSKDAPEFAEMQKQAMVLNDGLAAIKLQRATGPLKAMSDHAKLALQLVSPTKH